MLLYEDWYLADEGQRLYTNLIHVAVASPRALSAKGLHCQCKTDENSRQAPSQSAVASSPSIARLNSARARISFGSWRRSCQRGEGGCQNEALWFDRKSQMIPQRTCEHQSERISTKASLTPSTSSPKRAIESDRRRQQRRRRSRLHSEFG